MSILDNIGRLSRYSATELAENVPLYQEVDISNFVTVVLRPISVKDRFVRYELYRRFIYDVLSGLPFIGKMYVHEQEELLGNPWFMIDFEPRLNTFSQVLRLFRVLFSIIGYLRRDVFIEPEPAYIFVEKKENNVTTFSTSIKGPRGTMKTYEIIGEIVFGIKRPKHNVASMFSYGYKLMYIGKLPDKSYSEKHYNSTEKEKQFRITI